ncbi:MAG: tetratricopeptide repeat protein [Zetaproteobacteria bacterium]|nr:MAG: tetratricopeptide repeat protein [Zetaproteobacteria bacterium]
MRAHATFLTLAVLVSACATSLPGNDPIQRAESLRQQGRIAEARRVLTDYLERHPEQLDARYNLALIHAQQGDTDTAIRLYRANLARAAHLPSSVNLALLYQRRRLFSAALQVLQDAARAYPRRALPRYLIGIIHWQQGQLSAAKQAFLRALAAEPGNGYAHWHYARYLASTGQRTAALAETRKAVHMQPDCANCWRFYAQLLAAQGRPYDAIAAYQHSLAIRPDTATRQALITLFEQTGEHRRAQRMRQALTQWQASHE